MADFKQAFDLTMKVEGGYTNDPDDNGNWTGGKKGVGHLVGTNYGITAPLLMAHLHRLPTQDDMRHISMDLVKHIYKSEYWDAIRGDEIADQETANQMYDSAVNMGTGTAILLMRRTLGLAETTHFDNAMLNQLNQVV